MSGNGKGFFDQFLGDYFMESEEHLTSARNKMLSIESAGLDKPVDAGMLDELLRDFHSLKGLSAMVGLEDATQLAHHIENYLKELKRPNAAMSADGIERVIAGISAIEQVIEAKRTSGTQPDISMVLINLDAAVDDIQDAAPSVPPKAGGMTWRFLFRPSTESSDKGLSVSTVREQLREIGEVIQASPQISNDGRLAFEFTVVSKAPESAFASLRSQGIEYSRISDEAIAQSAAKEVPVEARQPTAPASTIRVDMNRLDELMQLVGELVISRFRLNELLRTSTHRSADWDELAEIEHRMERQLRDLRVGVMSIRMVPIGQVFERMRFVARGLERELNKRVDLRIEGQDTEIDKLIVERMMDPLLHLVRNAISHGLESIEERLAAGKPEAGLIRLSAKPAGDTVVIEVQDDGRGVDIDKIAKRAQALGWLSEGETLQSSHLLDIISGPGFTTRDHADLASGRGVGMSNVRESVNELGGTISLTTNPGQGTCFTIRLPLTLLIADSLMVVVGHQRFAVPLTAVSEVLAVETSAIKIFENNEVVPFRDNILPIFRLARILRLESQGKSRLHVLVVEHAGNPIGLVVDRIVGQREIVVRTVTDPLLRVPGVVGATELGDGRPVLILDPFALIRTCLDFVTAEVSR